MKHLKRLLAGLSRAALFLVILGGLLQQTVVPAYAAACGPGDNTTLRASFVSPSSAFYLSNQHNFSVGDTPDLSFKISGSGIQSTGSYVVRLLGDQTQDQRVSANSDFSISFAINSSSYPGMYTVGNKVIQIGYPGANGSTQFCDLWNIKVDGGGFCNITINQRGVDNPSCIDTTSDINVKISGVKENAQPYTGQLAGNTQFVIYPQLSPTGGVYTFSVTPSQMQAGNPLQIQIKPQRSFAGTWCQTTTLSPQAVACNDQSREPVEPAPESKPYDLCEQIPDLPTQTKCKVCQQGQDRLLNGEKDADGKPQKSTDDGIWTAVGCIGGSAESVVSKVMVIGTSIGGGVAMLMILVAAFMFSTSEGEPKRTTEAKEIMQAAVIGLLFIIFSITILQFIGVTILHIPGFGE